MRYLLLAGVLLFLVACASQSKTATIENVTISPGKVARLDFSVPRRFNQAQLLCDGKPVNYYQNNRQGTVYIGESYYSKRTQYACYLTKPGKTHYQIAQVQVVPFDYPKERITVAAKRVFLSKTNQARAKKERAMIKKIYAKTAEKPLFDTNFIPPLTSKVTSYYGTQRILNGRKPAVHLGNDLRAAMNKPITPTNRGRVVFAGNLFYAGNEVIIDHGIGVFSTYGHLNKINVKVGDEVDTTTVIGYAGKTGRVTGPHLHWGTRVQNHVVDGFSLVRQSKRDS